jgi:hypothetical protein
MTLPNEASIYTSPRYLRSPLREYFAANDKGIYWLQASRDLGKTQLVRGVIERQVSPKDNTTIEGLYPGDRNDGPRQFVDTLHANIGAELQLSDDERAGVVPSIRYGDAAEARADFVAWLKKLQGDGGGKRRQASSGVRRCPRRHGGAGQQRIRRTLFDP